MIPMNCPQCGRRGTVPPDRLNTRMHCKKCDAVFFMDKSGKIMLGDPAQVGRKGPKAGKEPKPAKKKADYATPSFTNMLAGLPMPAKIGGLVGLVAILFFATGMHKRIRLGGGGMPTTLLGRAEVVANAFADNAPDRIKSILAPGSDAALSEWFSLLRPKFQFQAPQDETTGNVVLMSAAPIKEDNESSHLMLTLLFPNKTPIPDVEEEKKKQPAQRKQITDAGYKSTGAFDVPTFWVKDGDTWRLDAQKCLDAAKTPAAATKATT